MTAVRDHLRSRVYAWEERFVAPRDSSAVAFAQAQGIVDAIWADMDLRFPPKVMRLPRQARSTVADATRLLIRMADTTTSWCLLHELAHAMSSTHKGDSDGHGPRFMGLYAQMLIRYLRVPPDALGKSLHEANIGSTWMQDRSSWMIDRPCQPLGSITFGDDMTKIDIDRLSEAELVDLHHRIVERLRFLEQMRAHARMLDFSIGDRVCFESGSHGLIEGILTRYNKRTVTVITDDRRQWNVSPGFLRRPARPDTTEAAGRNVIRLK